MITFANDYLRQKHIHLYTAKIVVIKRIAFGTWSNVTTEIKIYVAVI